MYWQKRTNSTNNTYYSFIQWDPVTKKNIRLKQNEVPTNITTDEQAEEFCKLREAEQNATKARIEKKLSWQKQFYDFEELQTAIRALYTRSKFELFVPLMFVSLLASFAPFLG